MMEIVSIKLHDAMISRNKENSFLPLSVAFKGIHNGSCGNRKSVMVIFFSNYMLSESISGNVSEQFKEGIRNTMAKLSKDEDDSFVFMSKVMLILELSSMKVTVEYLNKSCQLDLKTPTMWTKEL